jgi:hypothetical protein
VSEVDALKSFLNNRIDDSDGLLDELEKYGPDAIRAIVNLYLGPIPVPSWVKNEIADILIEKLMKAIAYGRECNAVMRKMVQLIGSPDALNAAADTIGAQVNDPTKNLAVEVNPDSLDALLSSNWTGDAADQYARSFEGQHDAVDYIGDFAAGLQSALHALADEIFSFYSGLTALIASVYAIVLGLVVAVATSWTGVGLVAGLVVMAAGMIGAMISANELLVTHSQAIDGIKRDLPATTIPWASAKFAS